MPCPSQYCATASTAAPKAGQSAAANTGLSASGTASLPWMALEVSQTIQTLQPIVFSRSRCGWIAASSAATSWDSRFSECQPETNCSPCGARAARSPAGWMGILWPFSIPSKPMALASRKHRSRLIWAPRLRSSSFDQAMGLVPKRITGSPSTIQSKPRCRARAAS